MKKSQFLSTPLMYVLIIIMVIGLIVWVVPNLKNITKGSERSEIRNFVSSLNNILLTQTYKYQGVKEQSFSLPLDVESVCFVDSIKEFNPYVNSDLNNYKDVYPGNNIYFFPMEKYDPEKLTNIELEQSPLCIKATNGKISLSLTGKGEKTLIAAKDYNEQEADCITIIYNGAPEEKIDIVFLANDYKKIDDFVNDVNKYIDDSILKTSPFDVNKDKFNFYRIDQFRDLGCKITNFIFCSQYEAKQLASNCPNDYIFVITDVSKIKDFITPIRSSAFSNIAHINAADNSFVLLHEFGHTFADLADEYVDESYYKTFNEDEYPNCDKQGCEKWIDVSEAGCFKGCSVSQFYRPTKDSIMRNYLKEKNYGPVNDKAIEYRLGFYKQK